MDSHIQQNFWVAFDFETKLEIFDKNFRISKYDKNSKVNERVTDRERVADRGDGREKKFALGRKFN